jgi:hypothetical protein
MGLDASHEDLDHVATWEQMGSERPPDGIASDGDDDDGAGGGPQDDDDASASEDDVERSEGEEADEHGEAVGGDGPQGSLGGAHNDDGLGMGRSASMLHSPALPPLPASSLAEDAPARRRSQTELAPVPPPSANAAASLPLVRGLGPIQRGERGHTVTRVHLCFRRMHCWRHLPHRPLCHHCHQHHHRRSRGHGPGLHVCWVQHRPLWRCLMGGHTHRTATMLGVCMAS